ncbi:hypothetical protein GS501_05150 [Saccharibacter sp. 17.LH.SD]|uniref:hypothetical protein n=1 Tax=Saccharibacter sp. 17.LH.SD TaxID=2689393 RepID=UPI001370A0CC|nr:hypothetical protein [Saccharibacter sp. 17.LH.SD]MXV44434.1 hypothetical protein [Saccharibacter sp. 17.LH.SD]
MAFSFVLKIVNSCLLSTLFCGSAFAQSSSMPWYDLPWLGTPKKTTPVIASEREISIMGDGMLGNYKEFPRHNPYARYQPHDRELGWTPGLTVKGSIIFDFYQLHDLYVSGQGNFDIGHVSYHGAWSDRLGYGGASNTQTNQQKAYGQGELGKAWRLTHNLLLITAFQGGYGYWYRSINSGRSSVYGYPGISVHVHGYDERYQYDWVGGAVHLDYAITPRFVAKLNGFVGSTFGAHMDAGNAERQFHLGSRFRYEIGAMLDYRLTQRWHLLANIDYQDVKFGSSSPVRARGGRHAGYLYEPSSMTQQLHIGLGAGISF